MSLPNKNIQNQSLFLSYLGGIIGTYMICIISKFFCYENEFIKTIAKNTLFIIFFHELLLFPLRILNTQITNYFPNIILKLIFLIIFTFILLLISYYTIKILEKFCPIVLGKFQSKGDLLKC